MYERKIGECLNSTCGGWLCTKPAAHGNFPCPYQNKQKCKHYISVTAEMLAQLKSVGYISVPVKEV